MYVLHVSECVATAQVRAMWCSTCCMPFTFHGLYSLLQIQGALLTMTNTHTHTHPYTNTCTVAIYVQYIYMLHVDIEQYNHCSLQHTPMGDVQQQQRLCDTH